MSSVIYAIVFSGQVIDGFQTFSVKAHLAKMLKVDAEKMAVLFSGKQVVLKRTENKQEALKYGSALKKVGADVKVKAIKAAPAATPSPAKSASGSPSQASGLTLSLAPNEGNLVEPKPSQPAPHIDISGLELVPLDGSPLSPTKPPESIELDLSEYALVEMDDSPLTEPSPPVPKLDAPDFGLEEPGALLETLKEEQPPVAPDISGLTLAAPGEDLQDPSAKPADPPPRIPDTSSIHLLPTLD